MCGTLGHTWLCRYLLVAASAGTLCKAAYGDSVGVFPYFLKLFSK